MQAVAVGFIIGVVQDSVETALNSSGDVFFTATAEEFDRKKSTAANGGKNAAKWDDQNDIPDNGRCFEPELNSGLINEEAPNNIRQNRRSKRSFRSLSGT